MFANRFTGDRARKAKNFHRAISIANILILVLALSSIPLSTTVADVKHESQDGKTIIVLSQGQTVVRIASSEGANAFSIRVGDTEYLAQPASADKIAGVSCGVPVLYPTPNRVKDSKFEFADKRVQFEPNAGPNFIHGLVNRLTWQLVNERSDGTVSEIRCLADFSEGTELAKQFPFPHQLFLTISVQDGAVKWTYEVDNSGGKAPVPFGFALHPYFAYQGARSQTFLNLPASHWMESAKQLPSGKLVAAAELDFQLGEPMSLDGTKFDDVFWGMSPKRPTQIEFREVKRTIEILASEAFTHLVVWTPDRPFFGIESQTCSTDAHNLHTAGHVEAAHLQICEPGEKMSGWVQYRFSSNP